MTTDMICIFADTFTLNTCMPTYLHNIQTSRNIYLCISDQVSFVNSNITQILWLCTLCPLFDNKASAFIVFPYIHPYAVLIDMSVVDRTTHNLTDNTTGTFIVCKFIILIVIANLVSAYKSHNMETPCNDMCFYGDYCLNVHLFSFWSQLI